VNRLRPFDIDPAASEKCQANLAAFGFDIIVTVSTEAAVEGVDIITTVAAYKQRSTILTDNMVGAGQHINAFGGDCPGKTELHRDILLRSAIFVEYPPQTRIEGEIQQLPADHPVTELWQVIAGRAPGRCDEAQITLFDSVGFATEDFSALRYVRDQLAGTDFYEELDMPADPGVGTVDRRPAEGDGRLRPHDQPLRAGAGPRWLRGAAHCRGRGHADAPRPGCEAAPAAGAER
jgi:ornithine cyclodeaminase